MISGLKCVLCGKTANLLTANLSAKNPKEAEPICLDCLHRMHEIITSEAYGKQMESCDSPIEIISKSAEIRSNEIKGKC